MINDIGTQSFLNNLPVRVTNNTIALNDMGMLLLSQSLQPPVANIDNNIFASNFTVSTSGARSGFGIWAGHAQQVGAPRQHVLEQRRELDEQ